MGALQKFKDSLDTSKRDGVQYRRAGLPEMICSMAHNGVGMTFYMLIMYASYIGSAGYGIATATVGIIITATKMFDGLTDAIAAVIFEKIPPTHGKIRLLMTIGWIVESLSVLMLYHWAVGKFSGVAGVVIFTTIYVVYYLGYTLTTIAGGTSATILTNDPLQRPMMGFVDSAFSYATPVLLNLFVSFAVLPRYDNQWNAPMLKETCYIFVAISFVLLMMTFFGVRKVDVEENFKALSGDDQEKVTFKQMWEVLIHNRPVQMYLVALASDKFAQTTASQTVVNTMLAGILIGSYKATSVIGGATSTIGLIFAFLGGLYVTKYGAKKSVTVWSWASVFVSIVLIGYCIFLGKDNMSLISVAAVPTAIYVGLQMALTATKMILAATTSAMRGDVVDYELERSGNYLPAVVNGVYSFINKLIGSLGAAVAAFCVAGIGYKTIMPQMGDKVTAPLFYMTLFLAFGLPIIGWLLNVVAMKFYGLDKERMVEVQKNIAERKAAAKAAQKADE